MNTDTTFKDKYLNLRHEMVGRNMERVFGFWSVSIIMDVVGSFKLFCP